MNWELEQDSTPLPDIDWSRDPPPDISSSSSADEEEDAEPLEAEHGEENSENDEPVDETESAPITHETEEIDDEAIHLERDLLAICNGLRLIGLNSGEAAARNVSGVTSVILTRETLLNLQDIVTLLRQNSEMDSNGERRHIIENLLINPKYALLETCLMPIWAASLDSDDESRYLEQLIFIFTRVLMPPDKTWKYRNIPHRVQWYLSSIHTVKKIFLRPVFWKGLNHVSQRLSVEMKDSGKNPGDEERKKNLLEEKELLRHASNDNEVQSNEHIKTIDPLSRIERLDKINMLLSQIETGRLRRFESLQSQLLLLKSLILCLLRLPTHFQSFNEGNYSSLESDFPLAVTANITRYSLWDTFEPDWRHFLSKDLFPRSRRGPRDTAVLWQILDFYGRLTASISPSELTRPTSNEVHVRSSSFRNDISVSSKYTTTYQTAAFLRHSKFNPILMKKRLQHIHGTYTSLKQTDKLLRSTVRRRQISKNQESLLLSPDIYELKLKPLGQHMIDDNGKINNLYATMDKTLCDQFSSHIQTFFRLALNSCVGAWILDSYAEDDLLDKYDAFKIINLMGWILHFKRCQVQQDILNLKKNESTSSLNEQSTTESVPIDKRVILTRIIGDVLALRCCLDTKGIYFVHRIFHDQVKKSQLRHDTDRLAKICLQTIVEQLLFGLYLMQSAKEILPETLIVVGQCVIEDLFKCNLTADLCWSLRNLKPNTHDLDFILYTFETTFLLIRAFSRLGGAVSVTLPKRGQHLENADMLHMGKTRRVELNEFLQELTDGRIIKNIMTCLRRFKTNSTVINRCLIHLLSKLTRDRGSKEIHYAGLLFQLSYFDLFMQILQDKAFVEHTDSHEVIEFVEWVVTQFWAVFKKNKFVIIELLFGKSEEPSSRAFAYSDPGVLLSVFTNYDEGLDHEYLDACDSRGTRDQEDMAEWRRKLEIKRRAAQTAWTPQENQHIVRLWDSKRQLPHYLRHIRRGLKTKRTLRMIKNQLIKLGVLEFDGEFIDDEDDDDTHVDRIRASIAPLLRAIIIFRQYDFSARPELLADCVSLQSLTENRTLNDIILKEIGDFFDEILALKTSAGVNNKEFLIDIPNHASLEILSLKEYIQVIENMGATQTHNTEQSQVLVSESNFWVIDQQVRADDFECRLNKFKQYITTPLETLIEQLPLNDPSITAAGHSGRELDMCCKLRVIGSLASFKCVESVFEWTDHATTDCLKDLYHIVCITDNGLLQLNNNELLKEIDEPTEQDILHKLWRTNTTTVNHLPIELKLPDNITVQSIASAMTAALEYLFRKRKQYLLDTGLPFSSADVISLGKLTFPPQPPGSTFEAIVQFILLSPHPLLSRFLNLLGFQCCKNETMSIDHTHNNEINKTPCWHWVLPNTQTLQRIETDLHYLRAYTMTRLSTLVGILEKIGAPISCIDEQFKEETIQKTHQRRRTQLKRSVPLFVVNELTDAAIRHIAKSIHKLRFAMIHGPLNTLIFSTFKLVTETVLQWVKQRMEDEQDAIGDFILPVGNRLEFQQENLQQHPIHGHHHLTISSNLAQFKDMIEFQRCLFCIFGRPDNTVVPTEWYWSQGCDCHVIKDSISLAMTFFSSDMKLLKKFSKGKISLDELNQQRPSPQTPLLNNQDDNKESIIIDKEEVHTTRHHSPQIDPHKDHTQLIKQTTLLMSDLVNIDHRKSLLDDDSFFTSLIQNAHQDAFVFKNKTLDTLTDDIEEEIQAMMTLQEFL